MSQHAMKQMVKCAWRLGRCFHPPLIAMVLYSVRWRVLGIVKHNLGGVNPASSRLNFLLANTHFNIAVGCRALGVATKLPRFFRSDLHFQLVSSRNEKRCQIRVASVGRLDARACSNQRGISLLILEKSVKAARKRGERYPERLTTQETNSGNHVVSSGE